jgi:hypothetical protein
MCEQGNGVQVKFKFEKLTSSIFNYNITLDSWHVYGCDVLENEFTFRFGKNSYKLINKTLGWNQEDMFIGGTQNTSRYVKVCIDVNCKPQYKEGIVSYSGGYCN